MTNTIANLTIVPAQSVDIPAMRDIYRYYVNNSIATFAEQVPDGTKFKQLLQQNVVAGWPWLVARKVTGNGNEAGNEVLGYAYSRQFRSRTAYRFSFETSIYLNPACLRQGVGSRLYQQLIDQTRSAGAKLLVAVIGCEQRQKSPSIAFHRHFGFITCGRIDQVAYKFSRWLDIEIMSLPC